MLDLYGDTLTELRVKWKAEHPPEVLVTLVRRQHRLEKVTLEDPDALSALVDVILAPGCLLHLRELVLFTYFGGAITLAHMQALAGALQVPGVLPALERLAITPKGWHSGSLPAVAGVLASGACPVLRELEVNHGTFQDEDMERKFFLIHPIQ